MKATERADMEVTRVTGPGNLAVTISCSHSLPESVASQSCCILGGLTVRQAVGAGVTLCMASQQGREVSLLPGVTDRGVVRVREVPGHTGDLLLHQPGQALLLAGEEGVLGVEQQGALCGEVAVASLRWQVRYLRGGEYLAGNVQEVLRARLNKYASFFM